MSGASRRRFLTDVGRSMLLAGLGTELVHALDLGEVYAGEPGARLHFGELEPLVSVMQETEPDHLLELLVAKLHSGTDLRTLVAAGALANARTFGGHDYIGFHTFMALAPAYRMALELPLAQQPLPVLKVLYRNAKRMQEFGGLGAEVLSRLPAADIHGDESLDQLIQTASRAGDPNQADNAFAQLANLPVGEAFQHLQFAVEDEVDVHRVVLAWRGWDTRELVGETWGHCLLRQSIRYCAKIEGQIKTSGRAPSPIRELLPRLLEQHGLLQWDAGIRTGDDAWLRELAETVFRGTREQAASAVAQALHSGFSPESIGEALSVAANWLVLHDPGRPPEWSQAEKPAGSCHGDSVGVHASDAVNAWRNIARVSNSRNVAASLIVGAFHTAGQAGRSVDTPYPLPDQLEQVRDVPAEGLLTELAASIRQQDQFRSSALASRWCVEQSDREPLFQTLLQFAVSEDGALHAEKYYHTVRAEYASLRPTFRDTQLVALARVTASQCGYRSVGYEQAKELLK